MESLIWWWLLLKEGVQREDESVFKLLVEDWITLASSPTSTHSGTAGKHSSALCLSSLPKEHKFLTTHIAVQIISSEIAKCSGDVKTRAWEVPKSWWEPETLWACINWNDDDRNAHFNTKSHHMVYFNISPYHLTPSFTFSMTPSLSARMTDLFSASSSLCLCFHLPRSDCVVQHFDSEVCWNIHNPWLIQRSFPIIFVCSWRTLEAPLLSLPFIWAKSLYLLSNACKSHLSHTTKPEVISSPDLPQYTGSDVLSCN